MQSTFSSDTGTSFTSSFEMDRFVQTGVPVHLNRVQDVTHHRPLRTSFARLIT